MLLLYSDIIIVCSGPGFSVILTVSSQCIIAPCCLLLFIVYYCLLLIIVITGTSKAAPKNQPDKAVSVSEVTGVSALVRWSLSKSAPKVKMFQLQYNCSDDEVLIYRYAARRRPLMTHL